MNEHRIDLHLHVEGTELLTVFSGMNRKLDQLLRKENTMSQELDNLTAQVEANGTVEQSAITLLQGLKAALDAAGTDPVKLKALSEQLGAQDQALADAIVANTPAAAA